MRFSLLRLAPILVSGLPLLAPPGWECRLPEPGRPPADERLPVTAHSCHGGGAMQQHAPAAPGRPTPASCCSSPDRAATPPARSLLPGEVSVLRTPLSVVALAPDIRGVARTSAFDLPVPAPSLQLLHCIWLC
jgi:hypothetical protein